MSLVKVKGKYQVTIPVEIREKIDVAVGDLLEVTQENNKITLSPKRVVDRDGGSTPAPAFSSPLQAS